MNESEVLTILTAAHLRVQAAFNDTARRFGLSSPGTGRIISLLFQAPRKGLMCSEIQSKLTTHHPDVTRLINGLVKKRFVVREPSEQDRRVVRITLTPEGRKAFRRLNGSMSYLYKRLLRSLSPAEISRLGKLLGKVAQ